MQINFTSFKSEKKYLKPIPPLWLAGPDQECGGLLRKASPGKVSLMSPLAFI